MNGGRRYVVLFLLLMVEMVTVASKECWEESSVPTPASRRFVPYDDGGGDDVTSSRYPLVRHCGGDDDHDDHDDECDDDDGNSRGCRNADLSTGGGTAAGGPGLFFDPFRTTFRILTTPAPVLVYPQPTTVYHGCKLR